MLTANIGSTTYMGGDMEYLERGEDGYSMGEDVFGDSGCWLASAILPWNGVAFII